MGYNCSPSNYRPLHSSELSGYDNCSFRCSTWEPCRGKMKTHWLVALCMCRQQKTNLILMSFTKPPLMHLFFLLHTEDEVYMFPQGSFKQNDRRNGRSMIKEHHNKNCLN
jgi:hypothetical protein